MPVSPHLQDRPIEPDVAVGLELIWDFMSKTCPEELAAYEAAMPDHRADIERIKSPGLAGLPQHKAYSNDYVAFQAYGHAANTYNSVVGNYKMVVAMALGGEDADVEEARQKVRCLANLKAALRPYAEDLATSKSIDLRHYVEQLLHSENANALAECQARVLDINLDGMSKDDFEAAVKAIEAKVYADIEECA